MVLLVSVVPKKTTEVPMMTTRLTTLHTPCETGLTRDSVLKANWRARARRQRRGGALTQAGRAADGHRQAGGLARAWLCVWCSKPDADGEAQLTGSDSRPTMMSDK